MFAEQRHSQETRPNGWVYRAKGEMDRIEAFFTGNAFAPHRHDTFTIGMTITGVQSFNYRGSERHSFAGDLVILHPDELHDGQAGTDEGFRYRSINVEPALIQKILGGQPLPFIAEGISRDPKLRAAATPLLSSYERNLDPLELDDAIYDIARALASATSGQAAIRDCDYHASEKARSYIHDNLENGINLDELEAASGRDRWELSRDFRALYGTSPYRYLTMCRLRKSRSLLRARGSIADVAIACSFSDQSHFTRQFKKAYGMTPKRWRDILSDQIG